jgi:hypothetical protein
MADAIDEASVLERQRSDNGRVLGIGLRRAADLGTVDKNLCNPAIGKAPDPTGKMLVTALETVKVFSFEDLGNATLSQRTVTPHSEVTRENDAIRRAG